MNHEPYMSESTAKETLTQQLTDTDEQGIVIIHCTVPGPAGVRVWQSTFLFDKISNHRSKLLHAENITMFPNWYFFDGPSHTFTLYFEALPKDCVVFDMAEIIPQPGGFLVAGIKRNATDVYRVDIE